MSQSVIDQRRHHRDVSGTAIPSPVAKGQSCFRASSRSAPYPIRRACSCFLYHLCVNDSVPGTFRQRPKVNIPSYDQHPRRRHSGFKGTKEKPLCIEALVVVTSRGASKAYSPQEHDAEHDPLDGITLCQNNCRVGPNYETQVED